MQFAQKNRRGTCLAIVHFVRVASAQAKEPERSAGIWRVNSRGTLLRPAGRAWHRKMPNP